MTAPTKGRILVTGGAGFIGSHTTDLLLTRGYDVIVADNLSRGHRDAVPEGRLREIDLRDTAALTALLTGGGFEAVIHFASYIAVGESMKRPEVYFDQNVSASISLLNAMVAAGVKRLVFSSTAAVYGVPEQMPITEDFPFAPISPYGESKVMVEKILGWCDVIHAMRSVCLRYFNAAGAHPGGALGERHEPETHLIPLLFRAIRSGKPVTIFGDDYPTPDGTCLRDYIHVMDLADAHVKALEALASGGPSQAFNVGTGSGFSVLEVIRAVERVTGKKVPYEIGPRREGDCAALVADPTRLRRTLGWEPVHSSIDEIVRTAWQFEDNH